MINKVNIEDLLYSFNCGFALGAESINKLLLINDGDIPILFEDFLKNKEAFLKREWFRFEEQSDGKIKMYEFDGRTEYASAFFNTKREAYFEMFKRLVESYNHRVNWTIKRPTPKDAKKFPELYHMKREPWGD